VFIRTRFWYPSCLPCTCAVPASQLLRDCFANYRSNHEANPKKSQSMCMANPKDIRSATEETPKNTEAVAKNYRRNPKDIRRNTEETPKKHRRKCEEIQANFKRFPKNSFGRFRDHLNINTPVFLCAFVVTITCMIILWKLMRGIKIDHSANISKGNGSMNMQ